jgi:hypothetical protein
MNNVIIGADVSLTGLISDQQTIVCLSMSLSCHHNKSCHLSRFMLAREAIVLFSSFSILCSLIYYLSMFSPNSVGRLVEPLGLRTPKLKGIFTMITKRFDVHLTGICRGPGIESSTLYNSAVTM